MARIRADGGGAASAWADATDPEALASAHRSVTDKLGPVELLAAFAGGNGRPRPTDQVGPEEWSRVIEGDLTSTFLTIRSALPAMIELGRVAIVTMSSRPAASPAQLPRPTQLPRQVSSCSPNIWPSRWGHAGSG